jgi:hypothetical protein
MKIPTSYHAANTYLGQKQERPCANNTHLRRMKDGSIAMRLHQTDVVTWYDDGTIRLNTDGWTTVTTKARINAATNAGIYQKRGLWYYSNGTPFQDGDIIHQDGSIA